MKELEIHDVAEVVQTAINIAFPNGYPKIDEEIEECKDWSEEQLNQLESLYYEYESYDGVVISCLYEYARKFGIK